MRVNAIQREEEPVLERFISKLCRAYGALRFLLNNSPSPYGLG